MAQPKYTLYKYVRFKGGSWRYCRAALYANRTVKPDLVLVGGKEEKHPEGNYYNYHAGQWIPAGPDALAAQRQQHALLRGNASEYRIYSSGRQMPEPLEPQPSADTARKKIKTSAARNSRSSKPRQSRARSATQSSASATWLGAQTRRRS